MLPLVEAPHPKLCLGFPPPPIARKAAGWRPDLVSFVVCTRGEPGPAQEVLLVQEGARHQHAWFLPAGHVDMGETFAACGVRECLEESGVQVALRAGGAVLELIYGTRASYDALHLVLHARAIGGAPKEAADDDTSAAAWFRLADVLAALQQPAPPGAAVGAAEPMRFRKPHEVGHILRWFAARQRDGACAALLVA